MMRIIFILMLAVLPLSACKTTVQDGDTRISVEDGEHHRGDYNHCPPGHAKKGWC